MSLTTSAVGFAFSIALIIVCFFIDKKRGDDRCRLIIAITAILSMMYLFFLLANILVATGVLK
ncbi:MAG: hypothetical protein ACK5L0_01555 [Candidatus Fimivivens sp.]